MEYGQRVVIRFLHNEEADVHDITQRLQAQFAQDAYALRTVQFWIGEGCRDHQPLHDQNRMGRLPLDDLETKILAILDKYPFESTQSISETIHIDMATILRHLRNFIGFKSSPLYWVPHVLTAGLYEKRMEYAQAMLPFLHTAEQDCWYHFVTGDES
jgi:hypothetical protein